MKKRIKILLSVLLLPLVILGFYAFLPRKYPVPAFENRSNEQFWELSTGSKIAYIRIPAQGQSKPTPILYLHGGPGGFITNTIIEDLSPLAEDGYDLYLYDQIGSGHSDRLANIKDYSVERHLRDLEAIVKSIGAEKVILLGQSWGAFLATLYVANHPNQVEKLILTGAPPIFPQKAGIENIKAPDSLHLREPLVSNRQGNEKMENLRIKTVAKFAQMFGIKLASDAEMDDFASLLSNELSKSTVCDTSKARKVERGSGYYVGLMTIESLSAYPDPRPRLHHCPVPLFILRGQCDNQKWGGIPEYLELFPRHQLVIVPNAGHSIAREQRESYVKHLRAFLMF